MRIPFFSSLIAFAVMTAGAHAQERAELLRERQPADRPALLVLGTAHFANPGRDIVNVEVDDVLSTRRQAEIASLVEQLARFKPTHIAVEFPVHRQAELDARYRAYRDGKYTLTRNEVDQIGLRLAARLGLHRVIAADWNGPGPGDEAAYDWPAYGKAHGQAELVSAIMDPERMKDGIVLKDQTIPAWLKAMNEPAALAALHRAYFDIALVGDSSAQPGAAWVGHWYARNLRIFGALEQAASRKTDRVLAIYGAGHAYLLTQFARESGAFDARPVSEFLTK